jgi:hypothetical protein
MAYIMTDKSKTRYQMNDEERAERAKQKALHEKLRAPLKDWKNGDRRYDILAWAFARGFKFRRCERSHRMQMIDGKLYEHNMPDAMLLWDKLVRAGVLPHDGELPAFPFGEWTRARDTNVGKTIEAWIADTTGAIAAPTPRPKKPYPAAAE